MLSLWDEVDKRFSQLRRIGAICDRRIARDQQPPRERNRRLELNWERKAGG